MRQGGDATTSATNSASNAGPSFYILRLFLGIVLAPAVVNHTLGTYILFSFSAANDADRTNSSESPSGRTPADMDPRRHWCGPSHGY